MISVTAHTEQMSLGYCSPFSSTVLGIKFYQQEKANHSNKIRKKPDVSIMLNAQLYC